MSHIFKETGEFVGDFDGLYRSEQFPWGQDGKDPRLKEYYEDSREWLKYKLDCMEGGILEIGCGLGFFLNSLSGRKCWGIDISSEAVRRAKEIHPHLDIKQGDITQIKVSDDIVILNEILWYILPQFKQVLKNIKCNYLIFNQGFLPEQKYYKDTCNGFNGLLKLLIDNNCTIYHAEYQPHGEPLRNGIIVCIRHNT